MSLPNFHRTPVAGRLRNRIGRRARLRGPVDPRLPPLRLSLPAYCGRGEQQLHDHHQRRSCHPNGVAALRSPKPRSPLGCRGSSEMSRRSFLVGLRSPPRFLLSNTLNRPQAVHRGGVTIFDNKVGRRQLGVPVVVLTAEWTGGVNGHAFFHEVSTSFESSCFRELAAKKHISSALEANASSATFLSSIWFCAQNGHFVSMGVPLKASQPAGPISSITVDHHRCFAPKAPLDLQ